MSMGTFALYRRTSDIHRLEREREDRERTCHMDPIKSGPLYNAWRFSCCGFEWVESNTDAGVSELPGTYCPSCGAKVVE